MVKRIIKIGIIVSIVLSAYVGAIYFKNYSSDTVAYIGVIVFNIMRIFTMEPDVPLYELAPLCFGENAKYPSYVYYMYTVAVYLAPICTAGFLFMTFDIIKYAFHNAIFSLKRIISRKYVVLIAYNDLTEKIIEANSDRLKLFFIYGKEELGLDVVVNLLRHNAKYVRINSYDNLFNEGSITLDSFIKQVMSIVICEHDPNISLEVMGVIYPYFYEKNRYHKNINIYCNAEDIRYYQYMNDYVELYSAKESYLDTHLKLHIFSIDDREITEFFKETKNIVMANEKEIHSVIVGFDNYGKLILDKIITEMSCRKDQMMNIDIISDSNRNANDYVNSLELSSDANVKINLIEADLSQFDFYEKLKRTASNHIDYMFSCISNIRLNYISVSSIVCVAQEKKGSFKKPMNLFIRNANETSQYDLLLHNEKEFNIKHYIIKPNKDVYRL